MALIGHHRCETLVCWIKGIRNHLYWSAMSTKMGYGEMIVAKWKSIVRHLTNKHENHPDELFQKCAHGELEDRMWLQVGMCALIEPQCTPVCPTYFFTCVYARRFYLSMGKLCSLMG